MISKAIVLIALIGQIQEETNSDESVETVIVTASKKQQKQENISAAVSVISKEKLQEKSFALLPDLIREEAGVYIQQTTPGQGIPIIRGLKGSENLHLVDGMRLNTAFFRNAPNQYLALVDPFVTEQIEVVRGPSSVLYGGDALGGVVNIVSHTPTFSGTEWQNQGSFFVSYDTADEKSLSNVTFDSGNEKLATTIGLSYQDVGSRTTGGGGVIPFTAYTSKALNNKWIYKINDSKSIKLNMQYLNQPSTPRVDSLVAGFGQAEPDSSLFLFSPNERQFTHLTLDDLSPTMVYDTASYNVAWQRIKDYREKVSYNSDATTFEQNQSSQISFQSAFTKKVNHLDFVYGLDFYSDTINSAKQKLSEGELTTQEPRFPDDSNMRHWGVFVDATRYFEHQDVVFGLRYSDYSIDLNSSSTSEDVLKLDDLTWHLGWLYHLDGKNRLFANLGRGFRPPNIFDLGQVGDRPGNRFNVINNDVKPETVHTIDFGIKHFSTDWTVDLAVFYSQYDDKIASVETGELTDFGQIIVQSQNLNDVRLYGLESHFNYRFGDDSEFDAVLNYTWGEEKSEGLKEPADRIPPLNGYLGYKKHLSNKWTINPKIIFADTQNRLSSRDISDPRINPFGTGGFVTYNLYSTWKLNSGANIRLGLENIFDKKYREHASGLEAAGRNYHASFNYLF
jgi:outer membrane receptor protein involved in Fe transport